MAKRMVKLKMSHSSLIQGIVLHLVAGNIFTMIIDSISKENKYVDGINDEHYTKNYISHENTMEGGTLVCKMKK